MGLLYGTHMGPIWATRILANPYGTHAKPGCTPNMGPIWVAHMGSPYGTHIGMFAGEEIAWCIVAKGEQDSSPTRQFTDTIFEDSSPTDLKTVHRHF